MRFLVIRHGESTWNAQGRWQGQADPPLTPRGEEQALIAARAIGVAIDRVIASDLQRAATTAAIIAAQLRVDSVELEPRLRERHAGAWEGMTHREVEESWPGYLRDGLRPPGFEPSRSAGGRALECLIDVARRVGGGTVLAVSHGGILRAVRKVLDAGEDIGFANLNGQWFDVEADAVRPLELASLLDDERPLHSAPL